MVIIVIHSITAIIIYYKFAIGNLTRFIVQGAAFVKNKQNIMIFDSTRD